MRVCEREVDGISGIIVKEFLRVVPRRSNDIYNSLGVK